MSFLYTFVVSVLRRMNVYEKRDPSYVSTIAVLLGKNRNETILDIGTGTGYIASMLCKNKQLVIGLDVNRNTFKSNRLRPFHAVVADAHHMPFQNSVFDATLLISVVEHLDRPLACISEIGRISKQNSLCITQLPNLQWLIEPHTKFPLLCLMPWRLSSSIKKSIGYDSLNLDVTIKKVILWFNYAGFENNYRKNIYHGLKAFRFLPWPPGWFLAFRKTRETSQSQYRA
jgi:ubiquinone/menaquinone biosynthesis C-methylase UbiE